MPALFDTLPYLTNFKPAFIGLTVLCLIPLIQSFLSAPFAFINQQQQPGMPLNGDHSLLSFRVLRAYANSVENLPAFGLLVLLAIMIGVDHSWVNWLVVIHVIARIAFWVIYYVGVGKVAGGPRTFSYVVGLLSNIVLAVLCLLKLMD